MACLGREEKKALWGAATDAKEAGDSGPVGIDRSAGKFLGRGIMEGVFGPPGNFKKKEEKKNFSSWLLRPPVREKGLKGGAISTFRPGAWGTSSTR